MSSIEHTSLLHVNIVMLYDWTWFRSWFTSNTFWSMLINAEPLLTTLYKTNRSHSKVKQGRK